MAERLLTDARERVDAAARRLHAEVYHAAAGAPKKPGLVHRALHGVESGLTFVRHTEEGIAEGVWGMAQGTWALTGAVVTDPETFARSWTGLGTLADIYDPAAMGAAWVGFGKSFTDWDEWSTDPGRALGHVIANAGAAALGAESLAGDAGEAGAAAEAGAEAGTVARLRAAVDGVNPHYDTGEPGFRYNCTHCEDAVGLRIRGMEAEAKPLPDELISSRGRDVSAITEPWRTTFRFMSKSAIERDLLARGDGADGVVWLRWPRGGGHVFHAVSMDGRVHYIDGQSGRIDVSHLFSGAIPDSVQFASLEGMPTDEISKYVELLGKSKLDGGVNRDRSG